MRPPLPAFRSTHMTTSTMFLTTIVMALPFRKDYKSTCVNGMAHLNQLNDSCGWCQSQSYFKEGECIAISIEHPNLQLCLNFNHTYEEEDRDKLVFCNVEKRCVYDVVGEPGICCDDSNKEHAACQTISSTSSYEPTPLIETTSLNPTTEPENISQKLEDHPISNTPGKAETISSHYPKEVSTAEESADNRWWIGLVVGVIVALIVLGVGCKFIKKLLGSKPPTKAAPIQQVHGTNNSGTRNNVYERSDRILAREQRPLLEKLYKLTNV